jgi:hypothetical protein
LSGRNYLLRIRTAVLVLLGLGFTTYAVYKAINKMIGGKVEGEKDDEQSTTYRKGFAGERHAIVMLSDGSYGVANYLGPHTHILERLRRGDPPRTPTDKVAMIHDIEYALSALSPNKDVQLKMIRKSDLDMIKRMENIKNNNLDNSWNVNIGLQLMRAKVGLETLGILDRNIFVGELKNISKEDIKLLSDKYYMATNKRPNIPENPTPPEIPSDDRPTLDLNQMIKNYEESIKNNNVITPIDFTPFVMEDPTIEQQAVLFNYYTKQYNDKLSKLDQETDPMKRKQIRDDLDRLKNELNRSSTIIKQSQQLDVDPTKTPTIDKRKLSDLLPQHMVGSSVPKISLSEADRQYYESIGMLQEVLDYNEFAEKLNQDFVTGGKSEQYYYDLSDRYSIMRRDLVLQQRAAPAPEISAPTQDIFNKKSEYENQQKELINKEQSFLSTLEELKQAKDAGVTGSRLEELYAHLEDLRVDLKAQEAATYDARDSYLTAKDEPIPITFTEFGGSQLPEKVQLTQNLIDKGLADTIDDYNRLVDEYTEAHNSGDADRLSLATSQLTTARDALTSGAKAEGILPDRLDGIEDDPETFVDIPDSAGNVGVLDKGEGVLAAEIVDPAEADLFLQKPEEIIKETNAWNAYSMVDPGFGLGNARQNPLYKENIVSDMRRFKNAYKLPVRPKKQPTANQIYNNVKPRNQQPVFTPIYMGAFGKDKFEDEFHDPYMKNKKAIFTNPYLPTNNVNAWENPRSIYHPEYALYSYKPQAVSIGETSKPAEYRYTDARYNMTNGVNTFKENKLYGYPKQGLETADNTELFTIKTRKLPAEYSLKKRPRF